MKLIFALVMFAFFTGCENKAPELPRQAKTWETYSHPNAPFQLSYPSYFDREEDGSGIRLRYDDFPSVSISWCTKDEASDRGLWPKSQPSSSVDIEGIAWEKYVYDHSDGPFYMHTIAYVTPVNDKYLAVEFRTTNEPSPIEMKILKTVTWTKN